MLNKSQVYDINNQIDILKNNNINNILPKGANLKDLSIGEYKSLIESKKNKIEAKALATPPVFNTSTNIGGPASGSRRGGSNLEVVKNSNLGLSVESSDGTGPQIKIATLFNRYIKGWLYPYNNKALTNRSYINLLTPVALNLRSTNNINIKYENFQFKRTTYNKFIYAMEKATNILTLAFKSSGCLISKPIFTIVYNGSGYGPSVYANDPRLAINSITKVGDINNSGMTATGPNAESQISGGSLVSTSTASNSAFGTANIKPSSTTKKAKFKVIIHLFYYIKKDNVISRKTTTTTGSTSLRPGAIGSDIIEPKYKNILSILNDKLLYLSDYLTKLFNSNIEIELVRLYKPYQESNILVQQLNSDSYNKKFIRIISRLFKTINIYKNLGATNDNSQKDVLSNYKYGSAGGIVSFPSRISGLNIKLAGRTVKEKVIPRLTVKRAQRGTLNRLNAKLIEKSMFTDKSRKGAFNFTVTLSHIFK